MPFSIRKIGKNKYQVYNTATGEIHSKGTTKKKAEGQFRLLQGVARKEVIGLEGGARGLRGEADPMGDRSIRSHINQYIDPRESLINMIVRLRDHYLNNPPQHESPQRVQITPEILQNPDPIYEHLDERYDHYRDRVLSVNTGGMPPEDWDKIVSWVAGTHDDTGIWGSDWTGRQELETYSPHELRYILTRLGVKPINGRPTERTDEIVGSQLSRMEFNAYDPVKEYLEAEAERSDDDDAPDQSHWEDVFNPDMQGLGRRRLKGGAKRSRPSGRTEAQIRADIARATEAYIETFVDTLVPRLQLVVSEIHSLDFLMMQNPHPPNMYQLTRLRETLRAEANELRQTGEQIERAYTDRITALNEEMLDNGYSLSDEDDEPSTKYNRNDDEDDDDDDAPDQAHLGNVSNTAIQGFGRRRLKGGKKWNFSNRNYNPLTLGYNALLNGMTENYRSDITKEGVRQDVDRNIEQVKKFAKNPNPVAFAKNEAEGQFSRYGSGYPANPSDYQPRRFL